MKKHTVSLEIEETVFADEEETALEDVAAAFGVDPSHEGINITSEVSDTSDLSGKPRVEFTFRPQKIQNRECYQVEPPARFTWEIPLEDTIRNGEIPSTITEDSDSPAQIKEHERTPLWIREWSGPFKIYVKLIKGIPEEVGSAREYVKQITNPH